MTVQEFIKYLETQDQEATVEVVHHKEGRGYYDQGGTAELRDFDPEVHVEYTDFRGNSHVKESDDFFNRRFLRIGGYREYA